MAFEALESKNSDNIVMPSEVGKGKDVYCPQCSGRMRVWRSHTDENNRFIPRHFKHQNGENGGGGSGSDCGGEGDAHKRCKAITVATLNEFYADATVTAEQKLRIYGQFQKSERVGDVVATFDDSHDRLGKGLVVEIQDAHEDKDVLEATESYLSKGYSVVWLTPDDFGKRSLKYSAAEFDLLAIDEHPDGASVYGDVLNDDGTVPNKSAYPIVAPAIPHSFAVVHERLSRVSAGWDHNAVDFYRNRTPVIRGDGYHNSQILAVGTLPQGRASMPEQFYKDCARKWFRETDWADLFTEYEWDTDRIRKEWGDECAIDEMEVNVYLNKWFQEKRLFAVLGETDFVNGNERTQFVPQVFAFTGDQSTKNGSAMAIDPWDCETVNDAVNSLDHEWKVFHDLDAYSFTDQKIIAPKALLEELDEYRVEEYVDHLSDLPTRKVKSIIRHNTNSPDRDGVSTRAILTLASSQSNTPPNEVLEALRHLVDIGSVNEVADGYKLAD